MRKACWWANLLLAGCAVLAMIQSTGTISGGGTGVRVAYLRSQGILNLEKACDVNREWCDSEKLGRFVAAQHTGGEFLLALIVIVVAILSLQELTQLRELDLSDTRVTDAGLVHLRGCGATQIARPD